MKCTCCGGENLKTIVLNEQEYKVCEDCLQEDDNLKKIYEVGE